MQKILMIDGMSCGHCSARVEQALNALDGVTAKVELKKKRAVVEGDASDEIPEIIISMFIGASIPAIGIKDLYGSQIVGG